MSNLFTSLTSATRALEAQRLALDVTGQNIANVNTPGYSRRVVDFAAVPPENRNSAGRGVEVAGIRAQRDRLLDRRLGQETTGARRESALATSLSTVEVALGAPGRSVDAELSAFFDSFARLAESPTSPVARQEVVAQGSTVAAAFRNTASRLAQSRRDIDASVGGTVDQINSIATRIAAINSSLGAAGRDRTQLHLQDEQGELVRQLSALADVRVVDREDGGVDVDIADGRPLVVGSTAFEVTATPSGPDGLRRVRVAGADITSEIAGGELGGFLQARDVSVPEYQQRLDEQAAALSTTVNGLHAAGYDLSGNTGQSFFAYSTPPSGTAGAARALVVDPAIVSDSNRVAAADTNQAGGNGTARALADSGSLQVLEGGTQTLIEGWSALIYRVGRDVRTAQSEASLREDIVNQVTTLRDQVSGVSLDEEALHLLKFQRAYEANARFFQVVDRTLEVLFASVGR